MLHVSNFKFEHVYLYVYYSCNTNKCEHYFTGTYKETGSIAAADLCRNIDMRPRPEKNSLASTSDHERPRNTYYYCCTLPGSSYTTGITSLCPAPVMYEVTIDEIYE